MEKIFKEMKEEKKLTRKRLRNLEEKEDNSGSELKKRIKIIGLIFIIISLIILTEVITPYLLQFSLGWGT